MKLKNMLPNMKVSIRKCGHFYSNDESICISRRNYRQVLQTYIAAAFLMSAGLIYMIYECISGNKNAMDIPLLFLVAAVCFTAIYRMRYSSIEKLIKKNKMEIVHALPHLINKVILLLNAGMFIEAAIEKISEDDSRRQTGNYRTNALYTGLTDLTVKSAESNTSLIHGLSTYANDSGVREFIRFAAIIENNYDKGDDLVDKLEGEAMLLWMGEKKQVEERAKLAGTKLSLPLMFLLLSLIIITSAPMLLSI